jgi:hypothetical protein
MKHLFVPLNIAIAMLFVFSFHSQGANKYTLEYNLEKGKTYKQLIDMEMNMEMNFMEQDMKMGMDTKMNTYYKVIDKENDVYNIQMTFQKIKMDMTTPMPFSIDSDLPESSSNKNIGIIKSLTGIPIDIQLTKQGKVTSVKGIDKLVEKLDAMNNEQFKQMFSQQFSEKMIQQTIEQSSAYFPGKPVAIGDSWKVAINVNSNGIGIINNMDLTLKQVVDNVATLELTGILATPEGGAVTKINGVDTKVLMDREQSGTIQLNTKTGWIVRSEITQKSKQNIEFMGKTMQQDIEMKATVTAE